MYRKLLIPGVESTNSILTALFIVFRQVSCNIAFVVYLAG
jgi:hypothetical protein